jgi:hypothetical protein
MPSGSTEAVALFEESTFWSPGAERDASSVLQPDILTPAQYFTSSGQTPYQRLLFAVLEDAICCFQRTLGATKGPRQVLFRETKEWLFDTGGNAFMSCAMICESLGIEPALLRRALSKWCIEMQKVPNAARSKKRSRYRRNA